jgi:CAP-Gly domain-containing linker protein 1
MVGERADFVFVALRIRYFDCAPLCGVFVAPTKLSRPDPRPPSVVSSYGRATPSGRVTPSLPNGGALNRLGMSTFKTPEPKISAGSRASKYIGLTAKQLSSSREMPGPRIGSTSPSRSPARAVTSIHTTPKATGRPSALGLPGPKPRPSLGSSVSATPRPTPGMTRSRIVRSPVPDLPPTSFLNGSPSRMIRPSGSGSGPFAKPITPTFSQTSSDTFVEELPPESGKSDDSRALEANARALEDRITKLISGAILANGLASDKSTSVPPSPAQSQPTSLLPAGQVQQLLARVEELEHELERVKQAPSPPSTTLPSLPSETVLALEAEKAAALAQVTALEAQANAREASAREEKAKLESKLRTVEQITSDVRAQLEDKMTQLSALEATVQILKTENSNKDMTIAECAAALNSEKEALKALEEKMTRTTATLQEDKAELTLQVEELRLAGQVNPTHCALSRERMN